MSDLGKSKSIAEWSDKNRYLKPYEVEKLMPERTRWPTIWSWSKPILLNSDSHFKGDQDRLLA
jgi:hypothetical protein